MCHKEPVLFLIFLHTFNMDKLIKEAFRKLTELWIIGIICSVIVLLLIFGTPIKPFQLIGQGIIKILIGALLLFFLNAFGSNFGIHVPINFITATISGFLGIPGVAALTAIQLWVL